MHQIRFPPGLRAPAPSGSLQRSRLASLHRSPGPFAVIKGPIIREGRGKESEVGKGEGAEGRRGSPLPIGESGASSGGREEGEGQGEELYGWGVQALLFPH